MESRQLAQFTSLIFANLMTLAHFSALLAMSVSNSAGEPVNIMPPKAAKRAFISGSVLPALIVLFRASMISGGVFLGAPTPYHPLAGDAPGFVEIGEAVAADDQTTRL